MLYAHYSNRIESLAEVLAEVMRHHAAASSVFEPDVVVVNNAGMGRWLQLSVSRVNGIAANVDIRFPAELVWRLLEAVLDDVPRESPFAPGALAWRLFRRFDDIAGREGYRDLAGYLGKDDAHRQWSLARRMAALFDQYLVYRPDWIRDWEAGREDTWQARLWRDIVDLLGNRHWAVLQQEFVAAMAAGPPPPRALPACINVFGIPTLSPSYLELLTAASMHVDVHLYWFNPCREYWAEIVTAREAGGELGGPRHYERGNTLLANWGRQGRETLDLVQQFEPQDADYFQPPDGESLLASIQRDILDLENRGDAGGVDWPAPDDDSLAIHSCHGAMREVEVLHDQLLARFAADTSLQPDDVLIMTPDIERYAPFIDAVFRAAPASHRIPYSIADQSLRAREPVLSTFMTLLDLPRGRLTTEYVFGVVEERSIADRFALTIEDIATVRDWIGKTGARWGFDAAGRARMGFAASAEHTWQGAFDRLVLGYAMPVDHPFAETLPCVDIEVDAARALGRFHRFVSLLDAFSGELDAARPAADWPGLVERMIDELFLPSAQEEAALQRVREAIRALSREATPALGDRPLELDVVRAVLQDAVDAAGGGAAFLGGGVTFCAMVPMRSIPFKLIGLIGMDDGAFPRATARQTLDLMSTDFRPGDRSRREDDRYLFLETLLCARQALYISFVGRDVRDNSERPPSVVVSDLIDYVGQGLVDRGADREQRRKALLERLVTRHPLQGFDPRYFVGDRRLPGFEQYLARAAGALGSARAASGEFIRRPLTLDEANAAEANLDQLVAFFSNPARYLMRNVLNVWLDDYDESLDEREPFELGWDAAEALRHAWLERYAATKDVDGCEREMRLRALLPHGLPGRVLLERELGTFDELRPAIQSLLDSPRVEPPSLDIELGGMRITGRLADLRECGLFHLRLRKLQARDRIRFIIEHLAGSAAGVLPGEPSRLVTLDASHALAPIDADVARSLFTPWLDAFRQGLSRPIHFFPKSAFAFVEAKDRTRGLGAAERAWTGSERSRGECESPYYRKLFGGRVPIDKAFESVTTDLLVPVLGIMTRT